MRLVCLIGFLWLCACGSSADPSSRADAGGGDGGPGDASIGLTGALATISVLADVVLYPAQLTAQSKPLTTVRVYTNTSVCSRVAFDATGRLYALCYQGVAWGTPAQIEVYEAGAHAPAAPLRTITGSHTRLDSGAQDLAVATDGTIYVVRDDASAGCGGSVLVFAPGSDGNVAPRQEIAGTHTELNCSAAIAVDANKQIYIGNAEGGPVLVFAASADGDVAPVNLVGGHDTHLLDVTGIALDASGRLYVADWGSGDVVVYPPHARERATAERVLAGDSTKLTHPVAVNADASGRIFAMSRDDMGNSSLLVFGPDATGNVAPEVELGAMWGGNVAIHP